MRYSIILLLALAFAFSALGQGEPHSLYGTLQNADFSIPTAACIRFCGYFGAQSLCFPDDSGVGRIRYLEDSGVWLIRADAFDPAPLTGEEVTIYFFNDCIDEGATKFVMIDLSIPSQNLGTVVLDVLGIDEAGRPNVTGLKAYPNPFNASCMIEASSSVEIYDISGKIVDRLEGNGRFIWNATTDAGEVLPSGVYFVREIASGAVCRILLMR